MAEQKNRWQIGERLYDLRNQSNYTQEELAERLDVSRQSVSKWELDKTLPDIDKLIQLSELYHVSLDYLVKGTEEEPEEINEHGEQDNRSKAEEACKKPSEGRNARKGIHALCLALTGLLLVLDVIFVITVIRNHTFHPAGNKQEVIPVDRVIEQYTKAEIAYENDKGAIEKETVWLDIPGVREDDYIFCYKKEDGGILFHYYAKTLLLPLIVAVILIMYLVVFWMEWSEGKRHERK